MKGFIPSKSGIALLYLKAQRLHALADELSSMAVVAKDLSDGEKAFWIESISGLMKGAEAADRFIRFSQNCPNKAGKDWELSSGEIAEAHPEGINADVQSFEFEN